MYNLESELVHFETDEIQYYSKQDALNNQAYMLVDNHGFLDMTRVVQNVLCTNGKSEIKHIYTTL